MNLFRRSGPDTGYYSDRNDARNGFRDERGYLSDHSSRWAEVTDNNIKHETYPASSHQDMYISEDWLLTSWSKTAFGQGTSAITSQEADTSTEVSREPGAGSWEVLSRFQDLNWAVPPLWHLQCLLGESPRCRPGHCWWLCPIVWRHTTLIRENGKKQQTFNSGKFYGEDFTPRISGLNVGTISRSSDGVHQQVGGDNLWCGGRAN